jgi:hypothetical protein
MPLTNKEDFPMRHLRLTVASLLLCLVNQGMQAQHFQLKFKIPTGISFSSPFFYAGDLDNDGFAEFVLITENQFLIYDSKTQQLKWTVNRLSTQGEYRPVPEDIYPDFTVFQDFNRNGVKDIILGPRFPATYIRIVDPSTDTELLRISPASRGYNFEYLGYPYVLLADVDSDHSMDLIVSTSDTLFVFGTNITTSAAASSTPLPISPTLHQNFPNPFNPSTTISWEQPAGGQVEISIYDINGRKVRTLLKKHTDAGSHSIAWDGTDDFSHRLSTGVYFYVVTINEFQHVRKMLMLK